VKARITAIELRQRLDAGDHPMVVDLGTALDIEQTSCRTRWARWIPPIRSTIRHRLESLAPKPPHQSFFTSRREKSAHARAALNGTNGLPLAATLLSPEVEASRPH
jgi:hypothetical protein